MEKYKVFRMKKSLSYTLLAVFSAILCITWSVVFPLLLPRAGYSKSPPSLEQTLGIKASDRFQTLAEADRLYLQGNRAAAEELYRQVKPPFPNANAVRDIPDPIDDPAALSTAGQAQWEAAQQALKSKDEEAAIESLQQLVQTHPEFVPGYLLLAQTLQEENQEEEAIALLDQAVTLYPFSAELVRAQVSTLRADNQRLEASIAARQFAIVYPDHPQADEFTQLAEEHLTSFHNKLKERMILRGLAGVVANQLITGNAQSSAVQAIQLAALMLQGESSLGAQVADATKQQLTLVEDPQIVNYITEIGQEVAGLMGRDEFEYEFYVIKDDAINAFALPGGKVFVNTGAIMAAKSKAELAGLMGHEVAHAVLSHGFQRIVTNNLLANLGQAIPFGDLVATLASLDYSRQSERQSDILGTRVVSSAGYAADGLHNFFVTLKEQERQSPPPYLSTHPATADRISYIEALIQRNGYNRYAFEGVTQHAEIQGRVKELVGA